ncbi:hypothetical protein BD408DRAFT_410694 [Parasitella parasitica]|nr:hypothetical protein BD408DRAFT_410694 [Parasitella parasitica]
MQEGHLGVYFFCSLVNFACNFSIFSSSGLVARGKIDSDLANLHRDHCTTKLNLVKRYLLLYGD